MSLREELLGFASLVRAMRFAHKTSELARSQLSSDKILKLEKQVDVVCSEIFSDHDPDGDFLFGCGEQQRMFGVR